jgi:hypothetical protein
MSDNKDAWHDGLNDAFNTNFDPSQSLAKNMMQYKEDFESKKNDLVERVQATTELSLRDAELIRSEIHEMIASSKVILERLEETLQIGAPPRAFEVYATLMNSRLAGLKELKDLSKTEVDVKVINNKGQADGPTTQNNTLVMMMDGKQLNDMIRKVEAENSLNNISTDFEVTEGDLK